MKKEAIVLGENADFCRPIEMIRIVVNTILYVIAVIVYLFKDIETKMSSTRYLFRNQKQVCHPDVICGSIFGALAKKICQNSCVS
jgi:hypothetical protein